MTDQQRPRGNSLAFPGCERQEPVSIIPRFFMSHPHLHRRICAVAVSLILAGCATPPPPPPKPPTPLPASKQSYWQGDGIEGEPFIAIDLTEQRAHFFKGEREVGQAKISSGKKGFETPPGEYKVIQKDKDHVSNLYGNFVDEAGTVVKSNVDTSKEKPPEGASFQGAKMPFFLRFHGGYGMHAGRLPGHRASHGCVRLPRFMAEHFFENAPLGTPVTVKQ
jgi:L,D-transpeptidase catalytic domain